MERYYTELVEAFVRGRLPELARLAGGALVEEGRAAGLRLHKFKRNAELPRVRRALGMLRALAPATLLDIGSGRGTFLWPALADLTAVRICAVDLAERRTSDIAAVRRGGVDRVTALRMRAEALAFRDAAFDAVTALEVLEHLPRPEIAIREAVRVARRAVVFSVPARADSNPGHLHVLDPSRLERAFREAGARAVRIEGVLNHLVGIALR